jgi:hypothetical protein
MTCMQQHTVIRSAAGNMCVSLVLGIISSPAASNCSCAALLCAFHYFCCLSQLALRLHPDKNKARHADEAFKLLSKAFSCLSNPDKRAYYDRCACSSSSCSSCGCL